ncbi:MAG: hypothetical protein ACPGJV_03855 [Bacteriovoracaceae bacterium]
MARKKQVKIYRYECPITGENYKLQAEAKNPDDLMSIKAYYQMNPDEDDRPDHIKKELGELE